MSSTLDLEVCTSTGRGCYIDRKTDAALHQVPFIGEKSDDSDTGDAERDIIDVGQRFLYLI